MLASRIPEELNLRTFELGMISFRPDPAHFRSIAVYADSLAFIVSPTHPLAKARSVSITDWAMSCLWRITLPHPCGVA
jgi:DNA-binding transcriptional LysR family regulator